MLVGLSRLAPFALVLLAATAWSQDAPPRAGSPSHEAQVSAALATLRDGEAEAGTACRQRLSALGRSAVPTLLTFLLDPYHAQDEQGPLVGPDAQQALIEVLGAYPQSLVLPELHAQLEDVDALEDRRRCVKLLGRLGGASSVEPTLALVAGMEPVRRQMHTIQRELQSTLALVLERHPEAYGTLLATVEDLEPLLQATVARAIGAAGGGQGLAVLERLMGRTVELDRAALEAVGQLDPTDPACLDGCAGLLSWHLNSDDVESRRFATASMARHGGVDQLDALLSLLEAPDARVRRNAHLAVRSITGLDLGTSPEPWAAWLQRELAWYEHSSPGLLETAAQGDAGAAFKAMRELSEHRLFRRELAEQLAPVLSRPEEVLAVAACGALGRLGGPAAVAPLEDTLDDRREAVARAAATALGTLSQG